MPSTEPDTAAPSDSAAFDRVSHGYAPDGKANVPPPEPLDQIVGDVVDHITAAARAEIALLEARGILAWYGIGWASAWGFVAACALLVALLALAFGMILVLAPYFGPLFAMLAVVAALLLIAAGAGLLARRHYRNIKAAFRDDPLATGED